MGLLLKTFKKLRELPEEELKKIPKIHLHLKYPKFLMLVLISLLSYFIFKDPLVAAEISKLQSFSYFGVFISGMFFAFGFSAPLAIGFLIVSNPQNLLLAAFAGGAGALISDMLIFKFIKVSFMDEFEKLEKTKIVRESVFMIKTHFRKRVVHYILYAFAGILIATPLPDQIGIILLAGLTSVKPKFLAVMSFVIHTSAIYLILLASSSL
ncbi:hypothetical protein J4402_03865 [Candidatus Pacearchaeota archaeon]|nr:hypothetical protein [Candidatus Pacearchaeota archaeon]